LTNAYGPDGALLLLEGPLLTEPKCFYCQSTATHYQGIVGIAKDSAGGDVRQVRVYVCRHCKEELEHAVESQTRRNGMIVLVWAACGVGAFVLSPILLKILLPLAVVALAIAVGLASWICTPRILRDARARIISQYGKAIRFSDIGERWRELSSDGHPESCTRCGAQDVTHRFDAEGLSYTHSEGTIEKKDVYARLKVPALLCRKCADGLRRRMRWGLATKIAGASGFAVLAIIYGAHFLGAEAPNTLGDCAAASMYAIVPFAIVFAVTYAIMSVVVYYFIEHPWLSKTEIRQHLGAQGFDRSTVKIAGWPARIAPNATNDLQRP
jgi:hypothetical protein